MANVKLGGIVAGIRGTVGGVTYSANQTGPYARLWSRGSNPRTPLHSITRGRISGLGTLWASMDDAGRAAWSAFAAAPPELDYNAFHDLLNIGGWRWFVRVNQRRQVVGLSPTSDVPSATTVPAITTAITVATQGPYGNVYLYFNLAEVPAGFSVIALMTTHPTQGLLNKTTNLLQVLAQHEPSFVPYNVTAPFRIKWGFPQAGQKLWCYVSAQRDDGVRGPDFTSTTVVV
jgi:hypothetical protein